MKKFNTPGAVTHRQQKKESEAGWGDFLFSHLIPLLTTCFRDLLKLSMGLLNHSVHEICPKLNGSLLLVVFWILAYFKGENKRVSAEILMCGRFLTQAEEMTH
jgi:hypothetical protein